MTKELTNAAQQALEAFDADNTFALGNAMDALRRALTQRPAAQEVDERAAFEAEMRCEETWGHRSLRKHVDGRYQNWVVDALWTVWQARASLPAPQQATPDHVPDVGNMVQATPEPAEWRDRLTVNLLRQGAGLTKTQIRALIAHAVDGIEPDPALFPATPEPVGDAYHVKLLIEAIGKAATKAGIYNGQVPLTGPLALMLVDDMATCAAAAPAGMALVPVEPTPKVMEAMLIAGLKECEPLGELIDWREGFGREEMRTVWAAMLAAAQAKVADHG